MKIIEMCCILVVTRLATHGANPRLRFAQAETLSQWLGVLHVLYSKSLWAVYINIVIIFIIKIVNILM